jgi:hypothetical protein
VLLGVGANRELTPIDGIIQRRVLIGGAQRTEGASVAFPPNGPVGPRLDLGSKPQPTLLISEFDDRTREVGVPLRVSRDTVLVAQAKQLRHLTHVYQVIDIDTSAHFESLCTLTSSAHHH